MNVLGKSEYQSFLDDMALVKKFGGEWDQGDHGVNILDTEGSGLAEDIQNGKMSGQEITEGEHDTEVE